MHHFLTKPTTYGALSLALITTLMTAACTANGSSSSSAPVATTPVATSPAATAPPTTAPAATTPASSNPATTAPAPASSAPAPAAALPGVVADCTTTATIKPSAIVLACADDGAGVQGMTWTSWTATSATGTGTFYEKLCQPSCAAGKVGTYPVKATLSNVQTSSRGAWFGSVTFTWGSPQPPAPLPPSTYQLTKPS
jgi:hypothetical protein